MVTTLGTKQHMADSKKDDVIHVPIAIEWVTVARNPEKPRPVHVYLLKDPDPGPWDGYVSCVVTAHTEDEARLIHPHTGAGQWPTTYKMGAEHWVHRDDVELIEVTLLGTNSRYPAGEVLCREKYEADYEET